MLIFKHFGFRKYMFYCCYYYFKQKTIYTLNTIFNKMKKSNKLKHIVIIILIIILILLLIKKGGYKENKNISINESELEVDKYSLSRKQMVETQLKTRDINNEKVLKVMETVPRHKFMTQYIDQAYEDHPVPIGYGQTISQPYIVALMTQSLELKPRDKVLEIGTGSGYQAAVLAELVKEVYTIEIIKELAQSASERLNSLGYNNVEVKNADGYFGWKDKVRFDAIIVTAAANHIPPPLLEQLKENGKLIIPLGSTLRFQTLTLVTKKGTELETEFITGVRFVPMTGKAQEE